MPKRGVTQREALQTRKPMDTGCRKCPATLLCMTGAFDLRMQQCDRCRKKMLAVSLLTDMTPGKELEYFENYVQVVCDKFLHPVEGVMCAKCHERTYKKNVNLPG